MVLWGGAGGWYLYYTNKTKCRLSPGCCLSSGEPSLCQEKQRLAYPMLLICVEVKMQCRFSNMERLVLNIGHARSGRSDVLFFFFFTNTEPNESHEYLASCYRPKGTKDHRELSAQRGTDMFLSLLQLKYNVSRSASGLSAVSQILLIKQPSANAAVGGPDTKQHLLKGRKEPIPEWTPASGSRADADVDSISQSHLPDMSHGAERVN